MFKRPDVRGRPKGETFEAFGVGSMGNGESTTMTGMGVFGRRVYLR